MNLTMRRRLQLAVGTVLLLLGVLSASSGANNYGSGTYDSCQYGSCSITLSTSTTVNLNVTPTSSGKCTIASDTVGVTTDNSLGYTLTMSANTTNTNLVSGGNTIAAGSGTQASPLALTVSSWGYRVDSLGGFGAGPTSAQSNIAPPATTFAGVPSSASPNTLKTTAVAAGSVDNTSVWYGVCANTAVTNGTYSQVVTYTAVTN